MPTREQIIDFLWDHSYKKWRDGELDPDDEYEEYPEYLADRIMELIEGAS